MRWISAFCLFACACAAAQQPAPPIERAKKQAEAARAARRLDESIQLYKRAVAIQPS